MLKLQNITIKKDDKVIVDNLSFEIKKGDVHYLMGPNGSGKSTLALSIMGYPEYEIEGKIIFEEQDIAMLSPDKRARLGLFLSMQYPPAIKGVTILSLLKNAYQAINGRVNVLEFRKQVLTEAQNLGLGADVLSRYVNDGFSGGERKRLELLQLIILKPKLAILDEPDSGLDIDALRIVSHGVNQIKSKENAFIVITHYQRLLDYIVPDFVHVLSDGKIVKTGGKELALELKEKGYDWLKN